MSSDAQPRAHDEEKVSPVESVAEKRTDSNVVANKSTLLDNLLPLWAISNLRSSRSRKIWLRCWVASWVCYLIILPNASLKVLGNAYVLSGLLHVRPRHLNFFPRAFFAVLASLMLPPNMPVQLFIFVSMIYGHYGQQSMAYGNRR